MVRAHVETDDGIDDTQDPGRRASWPSHQVPLVGGLSSPHLVLQSVGTVCRTRHSPCRCGAKIPAVVLVDEATGVLAEALPRGRQRPFVAAGEERSSWEPPERRPSGNAEQPERARVSVSLATVKVLVVDDDAASLDYFSFALETCGAVVTVATSAREALEIIPQVSPDVILSDIAMPGEDGYWLLGEIRRHADRGVSGLPVVAATAYGRNHPRERVLAAGFHEHLSKPVDPDLLCRVIAAAAGR